MARPHKEFTKMAETPKSAWNDLQGLLLALMAGVAYYIAYRVNELLDPWMLYAQGINLIFLPAGVKHIAILVARGWGALGCLVALFLVAFEFWTGQPAMRIAAYSVISTLATWAGIVVGMLVLRIKTDLSNLQFIHLPLMDLMTTALHGFMTNAFFIASGMKSEHLLSNAMAMMFGDYAGSFILLTCMWLSLALMRRLRGLKAR
jgi:hypothetical protein